MKNKLVLEVEGKKEKFDILIEVEIVDKKDRYILYTKEEKNDIDEVIVYAGILKNKKGKEVIIPVKDDLVLELLDDLLMQIHKK